MIDDWHNRVSLLFFYYKGTVYQTNDLYGKSDSFVWESLYSDGISQIYFTLNLSLYSMGFMPTNL